MMIGYYIILYQEGIDKIFEEHHFIIPFLKLEI